MANLTVDHITKSFGHFQAIKDLSMEVPEGTIFGFLGANGAGKTTTLRMILDILRPDRGSITWNGQDVREVPRRNCPWCLSGLSAAKLIVVRQRYDRDSCFIPIPSCH
jgi:ABC-type multidrug transport system ATPase subunit